MIDTSLTLTQLLNPPTINTLLTQIKTRLDVAGFSASDWETDSDSRIILESEAITLSDLWQAILAISKGGYLDTAKGLWLDLLAQSQYQLARKPAVQTIGFMTLRTVTGAGPYTFNAGDLVIRALGVNNVDYVTYRNTNSTSVTVAAGPSSVAIQMTADNPGSNANIPTNFSNLIIVTPRPGMSVTNEGVNRPAVIQTGVTSGPYPLAGKTLKFTVIIDGAGTPITAVFTFPASPASYPTLSAVSTAINLLLTTFPSTLGTSLTTNVVSGTIVFSTISPASPTSIDNLTIDGIGTANQYIGLAIGKTYTVSGSRAWITQYGQDAEADDFLIARCKAEWGIIGAGTKDAFFSWATTADIQTQKVAVYSNRLDGTPKAGAVTLYIAPIIGVFEGLDIPVHVSAVYNYIYPKMPIMSELFVGASIKQEQAVSGDLLVKSTYNLAAVTAAAQNAVAAYINGLDIGEILIRDKLLAAIVDVDGVYDVLNLVPVTNITTTANARIMNTTGAKFNSNSV